MVSTWQELQYAVDNDDVAPVVSNRFSGDWIALHMMSTVCRLTDQRNASYPFFKKWWHGLCQDFECSESR